MAEKRMKRSIIGTVTSDKMDKTVVVQSTRLVEVPLYQKKIRKRETHMAHDGKNECKVGDKVLIEESRPLSRLKRWKVKEIIQEKT
jgi:small subunit ribosomal protein S17